MVLHRQYKTESLGERGKAVIINATSDERKGYKVYISREKVGGVTQHVRNIETLTDEQNGQLTPYLKADLQDESQDDGHPDVQVHRSTKKRATKGQKDQSSGWTR